MRVLNLSGCCLNRGSIIRFLTGFFILLNAVTSWWQVAVFPPSMMLKPLSGLPGYAWTLERQLVPQQYSLSGRKRCCRTGHRGITGSVKKSGRIYGLKPLEEISIQLASSIKENSEDFWRSQGFVYT